MNARALVAALVVMLCTLVARLARADTPDVVYDNFRTSHSSTTVTVKTLDPGPAVGSTVDWGDHVVVKTRASGYSPTKTREFRVGGYDGSAGSYSSSRSNTDPAGLDDAIVGMRVGGKIRITFPGDYYSAATTLDVELVSRVAAPTKPTMRGWTVQASTPNLKFELSSDGEISDLQIKRQGELTSPFYIYSTKPTWLGVTMHDTSERVVFVRCDAPDRGPQPLETTLTTSGSFTIKLCSWSEGQPKIDTWAPAIGRIKLEIKVTDTIADPQATAMNARIEALFQSDPTQSEPRSLYGPKPSYEVKTPFFTDMMVAPFKESDKSPVDHKVLWLAPREYLYVTSNRVPVTEVRDTAPVMIDRDVRGLFQYGPRRDPALAAIDPNAVRKLDVISLFGLVFGAMSAAVLLRLLTWKVRRKALEARQLSEEITLGSGLGILGGIAIAMAMIHAWWIETEAYARGTLFVVPFAGKGTAQPALYALVLLFTLAWAGFGMSPRPMAKHVGRLILLVPGLYWAANYGSDVLAPLGFLAAWSATDAGLRAVVFKSLWQPGIDSLLAKHVDAIRAIASPAEWGPLAERALALMNAGDRGTVNDTTRIVMATAYVMKGGREAAQGLIRDPSVDALEDWTFPYLAVVLAATGNVTPLAQTAYERALGAPIDSQPLELAMRGCIEELYPTATAGTIAPKIVELAQRSRPDWRWATEAKMRVQLAQGGGETKDIARMALDTPQLVKGREESIADSVIAEGRALEYTAAAVQRMTPENTLAYLPLIHAFVGFGTPLPPFRAGLWNLAATMEPMQRAQLAHVLFATGDVAAALKVCRDHVGEGAPIDAPGDRNARSLLGWVLASVAVVTGDRAILHGILTRPEGDFGAEAVAEVRIALNDREALQTAIASFSAGTLPKWKRLLLARAQIALALKEDAIDSLGALPAASAMVQLLRARAELIAGGALPAITILAPLANVYPFWPEVHYRLGCACLIARDQNGAVKALQAAAAAGHARAYVATAEVSRRAGDVNACRQWLETVTRAPAPSVDAMLDAFVVAIAAKQLPIAEAVHRWLAERLIGWRRLAVLAGNIAEARGDLAQASTKYTEGEEWGRLGLLLLRARNVPAATEALDHIPDRELDQVRVLPILDAIAVCAVARDDLARAGRALSSLLAQRPNDAPAARDLANVSLARASKLVAEATVSALTDARELLSEATRRSNDPRLPRGVLDLTMIEIRQAVLSGSAADREAARKHIAKARELAPRDPRVLFFEAALDLSVGRGNNVEPVLATIDQNNVWANYFRGLARWKAGDLATAERMLSSAMQADDPKLATAAWIGVLSLRPLDGVPPDALQTLAGEA